MKLKIMSLNLKEYDSWDERFPKILALIQGYNPDIVVLQEGVLDKNIAPLSTVEQLNKQLGYPHVAFCPVFDYSLDYGKGVLQEQSVIGGLGVISQIPFGWKEQELPIVQGIDRRPRKAMLCEFEGFSLTHTHLSNKSLESRRLQWNALEKKDILIGDFNTLPDEWEDRLLGSGYSSSYEKKTYISYPSNGMTLDYCLLRKGEFVEVECFEEEVSDHRAMGYEVMW